MYETFWFEMAERPGSLLDITIRRSGDEAFSKEEARCALNKMYHNVAEEARGEIYCMVEIYDDSATSISYRGDGPRLDTLGDYVWVRRRVEEALHGDFSHYTILPRWMIDANSFFLYVLMRVVQVWDAVFNLRRSEQFIRQQTVMGGAGEHVDVSDEPIELGENVVPLFGSGPEDAA